MKKRLVLILVLLASLLLVVAVAGPTAAATGDPVLLNEVFASHSGTDDTEFIELYGDPEASLDGLSIIVAESDDNSNFRNILRRIDFDAGDKLGTNGFFLIGNPDGLLANYGVAPNLAISTNYLQNSSETFALVETSSISGTKVTEAETEVVLDAVALDDGGAGDTFFFGAPVIGPEVLPSGTKVLPAGARRVTDGVDTDDAADWVISDFNVGSANTPTTGEGIPIDVGGLDYEELSICEIQGDAQFSTYEGDLVLTHGVVTLKTSNGRHLWIQDEDCDGDPMTSDGIFVNGGSRPLSGDADSQVGDHVRLIAKVEEQQFSPALPLTRLTGVISVTQVSSGNALPAPVELVDLPNESIADGIDFWEPLEGMLVSIHNGFVVAPTSRFGEFAMLTEADANAELMSGYYAQTKQLLISATGPGEVDYNPERVVVDDSSITEAIQVMPGDRVRSLVGAVDYTFGVYKLQPASYDVKTHNLPKVPVSKRSGGFGDTAITTYNVENLFDLVNNPDKDDGSSTPSAEALETKLSKLTLAVVYELELPEILVVQEVENQEILQELADRVNAMAGSDYMAYSEETSDGRGIEPGFMWDANRVEFVDGFQLDDSIVPGVSDAFGPASPSAGREPLVGMFEINGKMITIVANHFKSKGGDDTLFGVNWPPERVTEVQRKAQAQVVRDYVNLLFDEDPDALVMVAGDLNDFQFAEPGEGDDHPVAILEGGPDEVPLFNLLLTEKPAETYSFVFDGNSQVLDHMLVSPALLDMFVAADLLHFNAGFPAWLGDDASTSIRAADHDPLEGRFWFWDMARGKGKR